MLPLAVTDSFYMLKRIRYRFLSGDLRVSAYEHIEIFTITKSKAEVKLHGIVFGHSRTTKMQDSLPLRLFLAK
jgi:hypothetical protein